ELLSRDLRLEEDRRVTEQLEPLTLEVLALEPADHRASRERLVDHVPVPGCEVPHGFGRRGGQAWGDGEAGTAQSIQLLQLEPVRGDGLHRIDEGGGIQGEAV